MVKKFRIEGLYDQYDYSLEFSENHYPICFISGPNGYGKTTILTLLYAVLKQETDTLLNPSLDYTNIEVQLDNMSIVITRTKTNRAPVDQDEEDYLVELDVKIIDNDGILKESSVITTDNNAGFPSNISMYLRSLSCEFLRDDRLFSGNLSSDENIMDVYGRVYAKMGDFEREMNHSLDYVRTLFSRGSNAQEPPSVRPEKLAVSKKLLDRYHSVGLLTSHSLDDISVDDPRALAISEAIMEDPFLLQLEAFKKWIDDSCLSHKHLVLDIENGAFFNTDKGDLLLPMQLSSGERHLYLQAYQLTIGASQGEIVLIDEPEMSYHPAWLTDYLEHITLASRSHNLQIILATHSPAVFGYNLDQNIDLYTLSHS